MRSHSTATAAASSERSERCPYSWRERSSADSGSASRIKRPAHVASSAVASMALNGSLLYVLSPPRASWQPSVHETPARTTSVGASSGERGTHASVARSVTSVASATSLTRKKTNLMKGDAMPASREVQPRSCLDFGQEQARARGGAEVGHGPAAQRPLWGGR